MDLQAILHALQEEHRKLSDAIAALEYLRDGAKPRRGRPSRQMKLAKKLTLSKGKPGRPARQED